MDEIVGDPIKWIFGVSNSEPKTWDIGSVNDSQKFSSLFSSELLSILFFHEHSKSSWRMGTPFIGH